MPTPTETPDAQASATDDRAGSALDSLAGLIEQWRTLAAPSANADTVPYWRGAGHAYRRAADQVAEVINSTLAKAANAHDEEQDRLAVARVRVDEAAGQLATPINGDQRAVAAELLAEIWATGEAYGVRAIDWLGITDLPGACLSAIRGAERRKA